MRNMAALIIFSILLAFAALATVFHIRYGDMANLGMFIVATMTAIGTCGVVILNLFPYVPRDKIDAVICWRKKKMSMIITNKSNHTVYLGTDKYAVSEFGDAFALWWPTDKNCTAKNSRAIISNPGDNLAVPAHGTIGYQISPKIFGKKDLSKLKIQICTSSGYRIDVKNELVKSN